MNFLRSVGFELPVVQAPMASVQTSALAIAVAEAGGLGSLPGALLSLETLRTELEKITARTTRPYNVNFFCHAAPTPDVGRETAWRESLAPYYKELDVDGGTVASGSSRMPFDLATLELLETFKPPVVSFHFGLPDATLMARAKAWGAKILSSATTVAEALWLEAHGVDAVIAQGLEAGGHRGMFLSEEITTQVGTIALLPQIVRAVRVPVIAAGGIADRTGAAAALALGASAVQVGTAYLACNEATTSEVHRAALKSDSAHHTALTNLFTGRPARSIMNRFMREHGPISTLAPAFPLATAAVAPLRAKAESRGSGDFTPLWAGQNATGAREVAAAEITRSLV